jgi:hypothetical protein
MKILCTYGIACENITITYFTIFIFQAKLLLQMVSHEPEERPTAQEIRTKLPLPGQVSVRS